MKNKPLVNQHSNNLTNFFPETQKVNNMII